jgi:hypothetical protein
MAEPFSSTRCNTSDAFRVGLAATSNTGPAPRSSNHTRTGLFGQGTLPRKVGKVTGWCDKCDSATCFESIGYVIQWKTCFSANPPEKVGAPPRLSLLGENVDSSQMFLPGNNISTNKIEDRNDSLRVLVPLRGMRSLGQLLLFHVDHSFGRQYPTADGQDQERRHTRHHEDGHR